MSDVTLAIDTTTDACSVALAVGVETRQALVVDPRGHLQQVPGMIADLLNDAGIDRSAIEQVVVSRGPGSFTGVRIGIGYAQGIALGLGVPLVSISTLETLARGALRRGTRGRTLVALDARMGEIYWASFELGVHPDQALIRLSEDALAAPATVSLEPAGRWNAIGSGAVAYGAELGAGDETVLLVEPVASLPEARDLIAAAALGGHRDGGVPVYLRDDVVSRA